MRNVKRWLKVLAVLVIFCAGTARYIALNQEFPNPTVEKAAENESLRVGNYNWTLLRTEWFDGSYVKRLMPFYTIARRADNSEYPLEDERVILFHLTVEKTAEDDTYLDLTDINFESGSWHNQFDPEIFAVLNSGAKGTVLYLKKGESMELVFPVVLIKDSFRRPEWKDIEERAFDTVLGYYPVKYVLSSTF